MKIINLAEEGVEAAAFRAAAVLREGGVVLYPTDTLYGLGADALSDEAVAKVKRIKGRDEGKPIHAIVADTAMTERFALMNESARRLAMRIWPGPLTLILEKKSGIDAGIARDIGTFGARAADNAFCMALAQEFGAPYTGTSVNKSGEEPQNSIAAILEQLGAGAAEIDLVIDAGELAPSKPSTVVDLSGEKPQILREGAISVAEIQEMLKKS